MKPYDSEVRINQECVRRKKMTMLGSTITWNGSPWEALHGRLKLAQALFWAKSKLWRGPASRSQKIAAWIRYIHPIILHGARIFHINRQMLLYVRRWEMNMLKKALKVRRRFTTTDYETQLEPNRFYNKRIAGIIRKEYEDLGVQHLHTKLLKAVYKEAWRLGTKSKSGLGTLRNFQSRQWWEAVKSEPSAKRQKGSTKHKRQCPTTEWEDPLVCGLGLYWRDRKADCTSWLDWKKVCEVALPVVLSKWKLPPMVRTTKGDKVEDHQTKEPRKKFPKLQLLRAWRQEDEIWNAPSGLVLSIADNEAMAEIFNGLQSYVGEDRFVEELLTNTTDSLVHLLQYGWKTKDYTYDMLQWRQRRWNSVADELANQAMDCKASFEWWSPNLPGRDANYMAFADGGRRVTGESASAAAVFAIREGYVRLIGKMAYYGRDTDSFVAECRAMNMATKGFLRRLSVGQDKQIGFLTRMAMPLPR